MRHDFALGPSSGGATTPCRSCGRETERAALDDRLWCRECHEALERTAARGKYLVALAITAPFAVWILIEGTRGFLPAYAWAIPLLAAWFLGQRIGREVIRGWLRYRRGD